MHSMWFLSLPAAIYCFNHLTYLQTKMPHPRLSGKKKVLVHNCSRLLFKSLGKLDEDHFPHSYYYRGNIVLQAAIQWNGNPCNTWRDHVQVSKSPCLLGAVHTG